MSGRRPLARAGSAALVGLLVATCARSGPSTHPERETGRPTLRLAILTDFEGTLEPCGCLSRPLGGIDRAAALLAELRADGVPTLFVSAGDLFFGGPPPFLPPEVDTSAQLSWRAETAARALARMGLVAASLTARDRAWLAEQAVENGPAALLANTVCIEPCVLPESRMRVGLFAHDAEAGTLPAADADRIVRQLREGGADTVVLLLDGEAHEARRLAEAVRGIDFVVLGGVSEASARAPVQVGSTTILHAARHGHGLLVLDLHRRDGGPWSDVSAWTRAHRREAAERRAARLEARIARWKAAADTNAVALAEQQRRLDAMRREIAAPDDVPPDANAFDARFVELGPERARDPEVHALLAEQARRVNEHNREALAHLAPPLPPAGEARYVGTAECERCHRPAVAWWRGNAHGHAYETLERLDKQFHLECVGCHVTGYGAPGGAGVVRNEGLTDVGCESCHGPASLHVDDPDTAGLVRREAPETVCTRCHNPEHSDRFEYAGYRARLLAPGHGKPAP